MARLHFAIMEWLCLTDNQYAQGLEVLMYAGFYDGNPGLTLWKKKTGFEPAYLVTEDETAIPATVPKGGLDLAYRNNEEVDNFHHH